MHQGSSQQISDKSHNRFRVSRLNQKLKLGKASSIMKNRGSRAMSNSTIETHNII